MSEPLDRTARIAGALYLIVILLGVTAEVAVRGSLIVDGDAGATAANLAAAPGWFRLGVAADMAMLLADVALAVALFVLLRPAGEVLALAATAFRLMQAATIAGAALLGYGALLVLESGAGDADLALLLLDLHAHGYDLGLVFFGLASVLVGILVGRAAYLPRPLGWAMIAAGVVYLAGSALRFLAPALHAPFQPAYAIPLLAESALCLWLLFAGVRQPSTA